MSENELPTILAAAQSSRDAGDWPEAIRLFRSAESLAPSAAPIKHNLAQAYLAKGETRLAQDCAQAALRLDPALWQSRAILAKAHRASGSIAAAEAEWRHLLASSPGNPIALLGLADILMNELGDPEAASSAVAPLRSSPAHEADAELTMLMASLYTGRDSPERLSQRLRAFSESHLRVPRLPARRLRRGSRRIGLLSPLFSASPVYYLTFSSLAAMACSHDLIFLNRGSREDHATASFREIAADWHDLAGIEPEPLASRLAGFELDILFDLGGWSDVAALKALSSKPAARMYKWVGGQSATTGLDMFDGWIGDLWQSPQEDGGLYAEPLLNIPGGYADYTPPPSLAALAELPKKGAALVGNPAKIGPATLAAWPEGVDRVRLIDRRYAHERPRARVMDLLARAGIAVEAVIVPEGHVGYLRALAGCEAIVNTQPYSAGLTAVEAHRLGVRLLSGPAGRLFCSRHHLSHARTGGSNPNLGDHLRKLVSQ